MCDIAPFQMECLNDDLKHQLLCCEANHLGCAVRELYRSIPIIGEHIPPYQCGMFLPKNGGADNG